MLLEPSQKPRAGLGFPREWYQTQWRSKPLDPANEKKYSAGVNTLSQPQNDKHIEVSPKGKRVLRVADEYMKASIAVKPDCSCSNMEYASEKRCTDE